MQSNWSKSSTGSARVDELPLGHPPGDEGLTVGDSMAHDVAGGAAMELDTALIMSGIHRRIFDVERGASANRAALEELAREYGVLPRWVLPRFRWAPY